MLEVRIILFQSPLNVTINAITSIRHSHLAIYYYFYDICFLFSVIVMIAGEKEVRAMMLIAHSKKMTLSGEYAFIYTELIEGEGSETFLLVISLLCILSFYLLFL